MIWTARISILSMVFATMSLISAEQDEVRIPSEVLEKDSMLFQAGELAKQYSGDKFQWQRPYAMPAPRSICAPNPKKACEMATSWFTAYPRSVLGAKGQTPLEILGAHELWVQLEEIGLDGIHTGPVKLAGQIEDGKLGPSIDGGFDRIGYEIDPLFGTEKQYLDMVKMVSKHGAIVAGDLVPGHTGKGPDFLLATRDYKEYPGIYHMVEIDEKDWKLLPQVPEGASSKNLDRKAVDTLKEKGYIIGELQQTYAYEPGIKDTNWSVTSEVKGEDGRMRRWVYLHVFKAGQPSLNWLDPTFGANRIVAGDIIKSLESYHNKVLRLDANAFLGEEVIPGEEKAFSIAHPLSIIASDLIAMQTRKMGGFTFQELDTNIETMKDFLKYGPDLTYDFITRGAYLHALAQGDADLLRLVSKLLMEADLAPGRFIHALQNHDEINMNQAQFNINPDNTYAYKGKQMTGSEIREGVLKADFEKLTGKNAPYNTANATGPTTTMVGFVAAALGIKDIYKMTDAEKESVKKAHRLLTFFTAMQPGVFAVSGWDLVGALPLKPEQVKALIDQDNDTRWLNRGAYDLLGQQDDLTTSAFGIPKAEAIYGPLPKQLQDPNSYASQLKHILSKRKQYNLPMATLVAIPDVSKELFVAIYRLPSDELMLVAINFSGKKKVETIQSDEFVNKTAYNVMRDQSEPHKAESNQFRIMLEHYQGKAILFKPVKK